MKSLILATITAAFLAASLPADQKIAQRKENQQDRIAQGVKSGQLTAGETARLETKETQVNRQQNRLSKDIYKDKHNSAVQ
jgi:hypothetical protein